MGTHSATILCAILLATAACGAEPGGGSAPVGDESPLPVETEACRLLVDAPALDWRTAGVGYEAVQSVELVNQGGAPCDVALSVEGPGFSIASSSVTLEASGTLALPITLLATEEGSATGTLHAAAGETRFAIPLEADVVAHCLELPAGPIDFGGETLAGCETSERSIVVRNRCDHPALLASVEMESDGDAIGIRARPHVPGPVEAQAEADFTFVYLPSEGGKHTGRFVLEEGNGTEQAIDLQGSALLGVERIDTFSQGARPRLDVLFVVDDSPAMAPHLEALQGWAEEWAEFFRVQQFDARFGVTTTSRTATPGCAGSGADGRLLPLDGSGPRWVDIDEAPSTEVGALLDLQACSLAPNEGIAAGLRATTEPLAGELDDPAHPETGDGNAGFLREEAHLWVHFVSARDDASGETAAVWRDRYLAIKGPHNANQISAGAIVPGATCTAGEDGDRYADLVDGSNGVIADLCAPADWLERFTRIGTNAFGYRARFHLTDRPLDVDGDGRVDDELTVRVDGVEEDGVGADGTVRWTYDAASNAIDFAEGFVPQEESLVEVAYQTVCTP